MYKCDWAGLYIEELKKKKEKEKKSVDMLRLTLSSKAAKSLSSPSCFRSRA